VRRWYVVQRAGRFTSPATAAFVQFVVEHGPALLAEAVPTDAVAPAGAEAPRPRAKESPKPRKPAARRPR